MSKNCAAGGRVLAHSIPLDTSSFADVPTRFDESAGVDRIDKVLPYEWACGAAGSALPWHGRGHRFDPGQVHQLFQQLMVLARLLEGPQGSNKDFGFVATPLNIPTTFD